ncbi:MAG: hypothetical protein AAGI90_00205 [Chlamydiota bacterium]
MRVLCLCTLFSVFTLFASCPTPAFFSAYQQDADFAVDGCVNPITGDYVLQELVTVQGAEPLEFDLRHFSTFSDEEQVFQGWFANQYLFAKSTWKHPENALGRKAHEYNMRLQVLEKNLIPVEYMYRRKSEGSKILDFCVDPVVFLRNLAHYGYKKPSKYYATRYNQLQMDYKGTGFTITAPSGHIRRYRRVLDSVENAGQREAFTYRLEEEILPNKNRICYTYDSLRSIRLSEIQSKSATGEVIFAWIRFHFWGQGQDIVQVETSDGQSITYSFRAKHAEAKQLYSIVSTTEPKKTFTYHPGTALIHERTLPNGDVTTLRYSRSKGKTHKKAVSLARKMPDGTVQILRSFEYYPGNYGKTEGHTDVYDAEGNKTVYRYDPFLRLDAVEHYYLESDRQILSHKDLFCWGEDTKFSLNRLAAEMHLTSEQKKSLGSLRKLRYLLAEARVDAEGNCLKATRYFYDQAGNVQEKREYGNISGQAPPMYLYDRLPDPNNAESRSHRKIYSDDGKNLLLVEKRAGLQIAYDYDSSTNLLQTKIEKEKQFSRRTFYEYDAHGQRIAQIVDDGKSFAKNDLDGVTQRQITKYLLRTEAPFIGIVDIKEHWYYDAKNQQDVFSGKETFQYNHLGKVTKKAVYDATGAYCYAEKVAYDEKGLLKRESNALYANMVFHDEHHRRIGEEEIQGKRKTLRSFNSLGQVILKETISDEEETHHERFSYDLLGRMIKKKNYLGQVENYQYNRLGQMVKRITPAVSTKSGVVRRPTYTSHYDSYGRLIEEWFEKKQETAMTYTLDDQLASIEYADGTKELRTYDSAGRLQSITNALGVVTRYAYDGFGRCLSEQVVSPTGKVLQERRKTYDAFHLLSETDEEGNPILYTYDFSGKKVGKKMGQNIEFYEYDPLGRLTKVRHHNTGTQFHEEYTRDFLGRVIEKSIQEDYPRNRILFRESYRYDPMDCCINTVSYVNNAPSLTTRAYDGFLRLTHTIDPEGRRTDYFYEKHQLENGLILEEQTRKNPSGIEVVELRDALGRLVSSKKRHGESLLEEDAYFYDFRGNLIEHAETLFTPMGEKRVTKNAYEYNTMNQIQSLIEFADSELERQYYYTYTPTGKLFETFKPDGVAITRNYDFQDRLTRLFSSDGTVDYTYFYDAYGRSLGCQDHLTGQKTARVYNREGRLAKEILENGLFLQFDYNSMGQKTEISLPDTSRVVYKYDPIYLSSISRYDHYGEKVFSHQCLQYDLAGNVLRERSSFDTLYQYDQGGRLIEKSQEKFRQKILATGPSGAIETLETTIYGHKEEDLFLYDPLGHPLQESGIVSKDYSDWIRKPLWGQDLGEKEHHQEIGKGTRIKLIYDKNGNLCSEILGNKTILYTYDALDRLICYAIEDKFNIHYDYDGYHRRIGMSVFEPDETHWKKKYDTQFLYDGELEIGRYQKGSLVEMRVLKNPDVSPFPRMICLELYDEIYYPLQDFFGNTVGLLGENLALVEQSNFTLFGEEINVLDVPWINPWRFASSRVDSYSNKVYYKNRYYSPEHGMWVTKNPKRYYENPLEALSAEISRVSINQSQSPSCSSR